MHSPISELFAVNIKLELPFYKQNRIGCLLYLIPALELPPNHCYQHCCSQNLDVLLLVHVLLQKEPAGIKDNELTLLTW